MCVPVRVSVQVKRLLESAASGGHSKAAARLADLFPPRRTLAQLWTEDPLALVGKRRERPYRRGLLDELILKGGV